MSDVLKIIDAVVHAYKVLPEIRAIALYGSRAKGTATDLSDINLMIVAARQPSQSTRAHVLSKLSEPNHPFICRDIPIPSDSLRIDGVKIHVLHIAEDLMCERVSSVLKNRRLEDSIIVSILHESRILWDPRKQLEAWKKIISPVPEDFKRSVIPVLFSEIVYGLDSMANAGNSSSVFISLSEQLAIIRTMYEIVYLFNNTYFSMNLHLDEELARFESVPEGFAKSIDNILNLEASEKGMPARLRRLCHLARLIGEFLEAGGRYNLKSSWSLLKKTAPYLFD